MLATSHASLGPGSEILCFIESELSLLLLASRCLSLSVSLFSPPYEWPPCTPGSLSSVSWLLTDGSEGASSQRRVLIYIYIHTNFINKTTSARCAPLTRPDKARTDRPVQLLLHVSPSEADERGEFVRPRFSLSFRTAAAEGSINRRLF